MPTLDLTTRTTTKTLHWQYWQGQRLRSFRECPLAIDTETEWIEDQRQVPRLALAAASDGRNYVIIHPERLEEFLRVHRDAYFVGHNVAFDFWVIDSHLRRSDPPAAGRVLWDACDQGRLLDTQILDMLVQLATGQFRHAPGAKDAEAKVYPGNLAELAAEYTSLRITKDDPHRGRYGELVGLSSDDWADVDAGFFEYAIRDVAATRQLYPAIAAKAYELMTGHGFNCQAQRYTIRPDALAKFGYLSEIIQVKASIVLARMFRRGVRIDLDKVRALGGRYRSELAAVVTEFERSFPEVLTYTNRGELVLTPKSKTPSLGTNKLTAMLHKVAAEIQAGGHAFRIPVSSGKKKGLSYSVKDWGQYAALHPFLACWVQIKQLEKRLGLLEGLTSRVLHCEYQLLMRTGRTSCSRPRSSQLPGVNIQQMPRLPEFRELFIPDPGFKLLISDYAAAELRTLAAVCKAMLGYTKLGDVFAAKTDPHAFTAASIQGVPIEQFLALKETDPQRFKAARQASKPINFGVPGGMGTGSLLEYAQVNYGVELSLEEVKSFRTKLITEIYPELNDQDGYLADDGMATLAHNLGVTEREAWEVLDRRGQQSPFAAKGVANVIRGTSTASNAYQAMVWDGLRRLLKTVSDPDPEVANAIIHQQGSPRLHDRLFGRRVATLTGRLRAGVGYTDSRNTPFQSLCADGGKLALWNLLYAGYDPYGFIHDEILLQLPAGSADEDAKQAVMIMVRSMEDVMGHDIPAECDWMIADCWTKP